MTDKSEKENIRLNSEEDGKFKYKAAAFLTGVTGVSMLGGFGLTLGMAKKKDPVYFDKGLMGARNIHEAGAALALRALGRGTLYAVTGFSLFCFGIWKLVGASDLNEFRQKAGSVLPRITSTEPPQGRTEFSGLNDLLQYIIDEDKRLKDKEELVTNPLSGD